VHIVYYTTKRLRLHSYDLDGLAMRGKRGQAPFFREGGQALSSLAKGLKGTVPEKRSLLYALSNLVTLFGCHCERSVAVSYFCHCERSVAVS